MEAGQRHQGRILMQDLCGLAPGSVQNDPVMDVMEVCAFERVAAGTGEQQCGMSGFFVWIEAGLVKIVWRLALEHVDSGEALGQYAHRTLGVTNLGWVLKD